VIDKETGEEREAIPSDNFPANTGAGAPDLSLMAKSRAGYSGPYGLGINQLFRGMGGAEHIVSILTGYTGEEKEEAGTTYYENHAFPGGWIAMAPPLSDDQVAYADGHPTSLHHMAEDTAAFLMWTAEPHMMARKQTGFVAVLMLILLTSLLYLVNKRLWADVKGKKKHA
jgi:ubiquinol-cytochrome c reductase cytochrome c1 subunit